MALFGKKTEVVAEKVSTSVATPSKKKKSSKVTKPTSSSSTRDVLLRPHITEKAAQATARNVYTFDIAPDATKGEVRSAVNEIYRVKPIKVGIVKTKGKKVRLRTRRGFGRKNNTKKAYVYLKKGDRIEFSS